MEKIRLYYNTYKYSLHNLSFYLAANIVQVVISLMLTPVLASNLSTKDFAIIGYYESFNLFILPFVSFSLSSYYSRNYFIWNEEQRKEALNTLVLFQLFIGLGSTVVLLLLLKTYFTIQNISFPFYPYAFLSFGLVYIQNIYSFYTLNLKLNKKAKTYFKISLGYNLLNVLLAVLLVVVLKEGAFGRMAGLLLASMFLGAFALIKQLRGMKFDFKLAKNALSFTWPLMLSALLTYFFSGFEKLLLERVHDVHSFGLYNIASKIVSYFIIFSITIDATFEPDIYKAISLNNKNRVVKVVATTIGLKVIPVLIFLCGANLVTGVLTNFRYTEATYFARILALSSITQSISFTLSILIVALGFSKLALIEKSIGAVLVVAMYLLLINNYGFTGAAWGQVLSYLIMAAVSGGFIIYLYRRKKIFAPALINS